MKITRHQDKSYTIVDKVSSTCFTEYRVAGNFLLLWRDDVFVNVIHDTTSFYKAWREMKCRGVNTNEG